MTRNLIHVGNSEALTFSRDMKAHLGLTDNRVEVEFVDGAILLKRPGLSFEEAADRAHAEFGEALQNLAK